MFTHTPWVRVCVVGLVLLLTADIALAARARRSGRSYRRTSYNSSRSTYSNNAYNSLAAAAQKAASAAAAARAEVTRAESALSNRALALQREFEASSDYRAALSALRSAQLAHEAARAPVLDALSRDERYRASAEAKNQFQEQLRSAREGGSPELVASLAKAAMEQGGVLTAMESERLNADPAVREARSRLLEAQAQVDALRRRYDSSIASDSQWQAARRAVDTAKAKRTSTAAAYASSNAALRSYVPPRPQPSRYGSGYRGHATHRSYRR